MQKTLTAVQHYTERVRAEALIYAILPRFLASHGHVEIIKLLVNAGAQIDATSSQRGLITPLHDAAANGFAFCYFVEGNSYSLSSSDAAVQLLLELGANIDAETAEKKTAIELARKSGYTSTVALLKLKGAKDKINTRQYARILLFGIGLIHMLSRARLESGKVELMSFLEPAPADFTYKSGQYSLSEASGHSKHTVRNEDYFGGKAL